MWNWSKSQMIDFKGFHVVDDDDFTTKPTLPSAQGRGDIAVWPLLFMFQLVSPSGEPAKSSNSH